MAIVSFFLVLFLAVAAMPAIEWVVRRMKRRKWMKMYGSICIGDRFIEKRNDPDPFARQWGVIVEITGKAVNESGVPYVKFKSRNGIMEESASLRFFVELMDFVPYKDQDNDRKDL